MSVVRVLARYRVALGGLMAACHAVVGAAHRRAASLAGAPIAALGAALRLWAAGHVEKSREVTSSGPYRYTRHPLYLGSTIVGVGVAVAAADLVARARHRRLSRLHAHGGDAGRRSAPAREVRRRLRPLRGAAGAARRPRAFSWERAWRNREHHALAGLVAGLSLLALKVWYSHGFVGL